MLNRLRQRASDERGFTLIELLVVILIIGILAAIAIPAFLNQKSKANDAQGKELARSAETTAETYSTDHSGSYAGIDDTKINEYEKTIPIAATEGGTCEKGGNACLIEAKELSSGEGYKVTVEVPADGHKFSVEKTSAGEVKRTCTPNEAAPKGGGCVNGDW